MAELEIDQSHLPRVQEVCQGFAVLEDGALAHNLQEQEIEHYYTTNIQKNQLVQNDIRMAKRLQDEEEEQRSQQRAFLRQASRQLEEQDSEYARLIQEEIQRCAEETHRREQEDEEMAKRIQEEEEQRVQRRSRGQDSLSEGSTSGPALTSPHQHTLSSLHQGEGQHHPSTATRWQCSTSHIHSDFTGPQTEPPRGVAAHENTTRSNEGHTVFRNGLTEPLNEDSEDSDTVFSEQLSVWWSQRPDQRLNTAPCQRRASLHQPRERNYRSLHSHNSFTQERRGWMEDRGEWHEDNKYGDLEERRARRNRERERNLREEGEGWQGNRGPDRDSRYREEGEGWHRNRGHDRDSRSVEVRERRCSRSESVRLPSRDRHRERDLARTWTYNDSNDKHVRFQDDGSSCTSSQGESSQVWEMLGQILRERGVFVRHGAQGAPQQSRPQRRDSQVLHGSEVSYGDSQPHQKVFQRAASTRRSYHGDAIRERRTSSYRENSERDYRGEQRRHHNTPTNEQYDGQEVFEERAGDPALANREMTGSVWRRWRGDRYAKDDEREDDANSAGDCRVRRTRSERRCWQKETEEALSSEEEEGRRLERPHRRVPQRSQSLSSTGAPTGSRSRHTPAGAVVQLEAEGTSLHLGELQQVLQDEELARRLQEEEDKQLRRSPQPSPRNSYPVGDFRVAQVAQDEEIARFMQKQEIKTKRRSRELEGPASWREHREMINHHDRRAARERQVQRERLDSEGLPSPTEDFSPENQPPSPVSTIPQAQQIRNIAEELDPTFQARRQGSETLRGGQTGLACQPLPIPHSGLHDLLEEPTFIPPTKRQNDKSQRTKAKEKKENCKQQ